MAKRFFYNKVYNSKKNIINIVIIGVCIIGVIICFIFVSSFEGESHNKEMNYDLNTAGVTIEVNENFSNEIFLTRIEDNLDLTKIHVKYPDNFDISKVGTYDLIITIDGDDNKDGYKVPMTIIDTTRPDVILKPVTIKPNGDYSARDFVESCSDNSKQECTIDFFQEGIDEEGNLIDYTAFKDEGTYSIKIVASDEAGNQNVQETMLYIQKDTTTTPTEPEPQTCKYGNNEYDKDKYVLTTDITSNNCALSIDLYQDAINLYEDNLSKQTLIKVIDSEVLRIKKDVEALNLYGILRLEQHIEVILNTTGRGLVGYQLNMVVTKEDNDHNIETIANYRLNQDGKRIYSENPYNLPE